MNSFFDKLNLRPQERRLVVIVGIVVFVVLNFVFVFPNFGAFGRIQQRTMDAGKKLDLYNSEIGRQSTYQREINTLRTQGASVATEDQVLTLADNVNSHAALSGVTIAAMTPMQRGSTTGKTNAFFEEQSVVVSVNTGEKELVDFLYRLADKDLLIRARSMEISPDVPRMRLQGRITLVKSFQRKPPGKQALTGSASAPARPSTSAPTTAARSNTPAAPPATNAPLTPSKPTSAVPARTTNVPARMPATPPTFTPGAGTNRFRRIPPTQVK
jgi:hypothetical protein